MTNNFHEFEHKFWSKIGKKYAEGFGIATKQIVLPVLNELNLSDSELLLDVACGPGYVTEIAKDNQLNIIGVDFSKEMITLAKQLNPTSKFYVGDAQKLQFETGTFDGVCTNFGMLHFSCPEKALKEFYRVLKKSGKFTYSVWGNIDNGSAIGLIMNAISEANIKTHGLPEGPSFFKFANYKQALYSLTKVGFSEIKSKKILIDWHIETAESFVNNFKNGGARIGEILRQQSHHDYTKIIEIVNNNLSKYPKNASGQRIVKTPVFIVSGVK
ncbi:class I SAM-dependent methyltransferase [Francisella sp. 19X1-34]|uniref:class I SAM-dependent methyltransferase n=1 Tax=Francisella sp. 19X1-34 TaxID=3087177 RepID=UPI002E3705FE|nr:class I SAM-dependent methyltransferase [Francisella sp. 19X1-34]MED7787890.1 class I SAM-dependent methyltransferase [Francisella sp. 19X1-34]